MSFCHATCCVRAQLRQGLADAPSGWRFIEAYMHGYERFRSHSGVTPAEQEVVFLAISRENGCTDCVTAHSFLADKLSGVPGAVTDAIREGKPIPDARKGVRPRIRSRWTAGRTARSRVCTTSTRCIVGLAAP